MEFGIIGCGLIGRKRAKSLIDKHKITMVHDMDISQARSLAADIPECKVGSLEELFALQSIEAVVVAVRHDSLAPITLEALNAGKHVLVEKPAARNAMELKPVLEKAEESGLTVKVGYNHRFHPSIIQAKRLVDIGALGHLMFIRGRYGHGGRVGYEKEWRARRTISGGGELIDQGSHLIDLSQFFLGDFDKIDGLISTCFWEMEVEDNCFLTLQTPSKQVAWLQASWSEWKNLFSFEIYGRKGKLQIDGLGGSYGIEKLTYYEMSSEMGPPKTTSWEFPFPDESWQMEIDEFISAIEAGRPPVGNIREAVSVLNIIDAIYKENEVQ